MSDTFSGALIAFGGILVGFLGSLLVELIRRNEARKRWLADKIIERQYISFQDFFTSLLQCKETMMKCFILDSNKSVEQHWKMIFEAKDSYAILHNRLQHISLFLSMKDFKEFGDLVNKISDCQKEMAISIDELGYIKTSINDLGSSDLSEVIGKIYSAISNNYFKVGHLQKYIDNAIK